MRTTFILFFLGFIPTILPATHNRAGEIIFEQTGAFEIKATIVTYTKTSSIPADRDSLMICWGDGNCEFLGRANNNGQELEHDFKVNYYIGFHGYAALGKYTISMLDPNRNGGILNLNAPNSDFIPFHLASTFNLMDISMEGSNRSPNLLESPIDIGFVRQPFMHTPNAVDLDGDSIAYELIIPLGENGEEVPNYVSVDKIGEGAENTFSFDEKTGLFVWTSPQMVGEYNIAMKIKSYRNGVLQDEIIRDMQILILPDANQPPIISSEDLTNNIIEINAGKELAINFTAIEPDEQVFDGTPIVSVTGDIFDRGAILTSLPSLGSANYNLTWLVDEMDVRTMPYQIAIKAVDSQGLSTFKVVRIKVNPFSTSTNETFSDLGFQLFPNPTDGHFTLQIPNNQINQSITVSIFDALGRPVRQQYYDKVQHQLSIETHQLSAGNYFIQVNTLSSRFTSLLMVY